jgi:hypothetical protein
MFRYNIKIIVLALYMKNRDYIFTKKKLSTNCVKFIKYNKI